MFQELRDKWKLFREEVQLPAYILEHEAESELAFQELQRERQAVQVLTNLPGWELLMNYVDKKVEYARSQLELKDDPDLRAEIKAYRSLKSFLAIYNG